MRHAHQAVIPMDNKVVSFEPAIELNHSSSHLATRICDLHGLMWLKISKM